MDRVFKVLRRLVLGLIRGYQWTISPWLGNNCRFAPSCSDYAIDAVTQYGAVRGGWLALKRLARCHPWSAGGYDPVPPVPAPVNLVDCGCAEHAHAGKKTAEKSDKAEP